MLHISCFDQSLSDLLNLILLNASNNIYMLSNRKFTTMCKWQFSLIIYIQQNTNKKDKQANIEWTSRKLIRIKKRNTKNGSIGI